MSGSAVTRGDIVTEVGLIRRYRGPIGEVIVLGAGFVMGVAVLSGAASLMFAFV